MDYYEEILNHKVNLLIVGRDPYPKDATIIPFSKKSWAELQKKTCSGFYLLKGLGYDVATISKTEYPTPNDFFYRELLISKGIAFINACHYFILGKLDTKSEFDVSQYNYRIELLNQENITVSEVKNCPIFKQAEKIVVAKSALEILSKYKNACHKEKKIFVVAHPDFRNKESLKKNESRHIEHTKIWNTYRGLLDVLDDPQNSLCTRIL